MNCLEKSVKGDMIKILGVQILISKKKSRQEWKRWYHTQHKNLEGIQFSQPYGNHFNISWNPNILKVYVFFL